MDPVSDATGMNFDALQNRIDAAQKATDKLAKTVDDIYKKIGEVPDLAQSAGRAPSFSKSQHIPTSGNGGSPNMPGDPGSAGGGMGNWMDKLKFGVQLAGNLLPNAAAGINRQQMRYDTAIQMGGGTPLNNARYQRQEIAVNAAMSGRMANVQSAYQVSQVAATTGIAGERNVANLASLSAAGFKNTGMDNAQLAQAHANMVTSANFNNTALAMGIRTHDAQGNYLTGDDLYSQIYNRLGIAGKTEDQILTQMAPGRAIGNVLAGLGMSAEEQQNFQAYAMNKNGVAGYTMAGDTKTSKASPRDSSSKVVQAESEYIGVGMEAAVEGYNLMNDGMAKFTEGLTAVYEQFKPLADTLQKINGGFVALDNSGSSASKALAGLALELPEFLGSFGGSLGGSLLGDALGGGGKAGKLGGLLKGGGKMLLRGGPVAAASTAAVMGLEKLGRRDGNVSGLDAFGSLLGGAGAGAATGAALGSVIPGVGTAIGAVGGTIVGGILGLKGATDKKKELEAQGVNIDAGEVMMNGVKYAPVTKAVGDWNVSKNQLAKLHQNEMVLPADVAESFRTAVQNHIVAGGADNKRSGGGLVKVDVTLTNASWTEAQRLVKIVQEAVDTSRDLEMLAST